MIRLEYFTKDDFQQLIDWIPNASFALQWGGPAFTYPLTHEQLENYVEDANHENASTSIFKVLDAASNEIVGHIALENVNRAHENARVGKVLIGPNTRRGKGYGTHMLLAVLQFAFEELQLHKVTLGVFDFNLAAIACYEKVGFQQEGFLRDASKHGNEYWNLIEMGILENEWRQHH